MCANGCRVGIVVYAIVQTIAFAFYLIGTPIDMYRSRSDSDGFLDSVQNFNTRCLTLWGAKPKCGDTKYPKETRTANLYKACDGRRTRFQAAEAFSIITIVLMLVAVIFAFVQLCCCRCLRWVCLILNILAFICGIIPWAIVADSYNNGYKLTGINLFLGYCSAFKTTMRYGAGFALLIVGWALGGLAIIPLMVPC